MHLVIQLLSRSSNKKDSTGVTAILLFTGAFGLRLEKLVRKRRMKFFSSVKISDGAECHRSFASVRKTPSRSSSNRFAGEKIVNLGLVYKYRCALIFRRKNFVQDT